MQHSDKGSQYVSIRCSERRAEPDSELSVRSVGDTYDNARSETINGLYKAELIHRRGPWRSLEAVEFATLTWFDWFNHRQLLEPIGNIPPNSGGQLLAKMRRSEGRRTLRRRFSARNTMRFPVAVATSSLEVVDCDDAEVLRPARWDASQRSR